MSKRTRNSTRPTELSADALTVVAGQLCALDRARFRLVCQRWRQAVRARREQLYWYCYRRAFACMNPECQSEGALCAEGWQFLYGEERLLACPLAPAVFRFGFHLYVMRVMPARLALRDDDRQFDIVCETGHWSGVYTLTRNVMYSRGYIPRHHSLPLEPDQWKHCRFAYLPINA
jgi:hypothetical protein